MIALKSAASTLDALPSCTGYSNPIDFEAVLLQSFLICTLAPVLQILAMACWSSRLASFFFFFPLASLNLVYKKGIIRVPTL